MSEQITKIPDDLEDNKSKKEKKKDPKKFAAGTALARKNKEARWALKNQNQNQKEESYSFLDLSNQIIYISSLVGAGFTVYQTYKFFYPKTNKEVEINEIETNEIETNEEPKTIKYRYGSV